MSEPKKSDRWEIVSVLKASEIADRTPALRLALRKPINLRTMTLNDFSVTTGFWDREKGMFFASKYFTATYYMDMVALFATVVEMMVKFNESFRSELLEPKRKKSKRERIPDVAPKELRASIGEIIKAK